MFWKYAANLQQKTIPKCDFNIVVKQFIEITLQQERFPVNLLHIFRTQVPKNLPGGLLLLIANSWHFRDIKESCKIILELAFLIVYKFMGIYEHLSWNKIVPDFLNIMIQYFGFLSLQPLILDFILEWNN